MAPPDAPRRRPAQQGDEEEEEEEEEGEEEKEEEEEVEEQCVEEAGKGARVASASCVACRAALRHPVTLHCGHQFCRSCLSRRWKGRGHRHSSCPQCRLRKRKTPSSPRPEARPKRPCVAAAATGGNDDADEGAGEDWEDEAAVASSMAPEREPRERLAERGEGSPARGSSWPGGEERRAMSPTGRRASPTWDQTPPICPEDSPPAAAASATVRGGECGPCPRHQETLRLFCQEDQEPLCVLCHLSPEHHGHRVVSLGEAGDLVWARLRAAAEGLRVRRAALEQEGGRREQRAETLARQVEIRRQKLAAELEDLSQFLREAGRRLLEPLRAAEHEAREVARLQAQCLSAQALRLDRLLADVDAWQSLPATRLLADQGARVGLRRAEVEARRGPAAAGGGQPLERALGALARKQAVLREAAWAFRQRLETEQERKEGPPLRFLPASAHPSLSVEDDGRSLRRVGEGPPSPLPASPEAGRFTECPCVLGDAVFSSGTHYWEVDVSGAAVWAAGVAQEAARRCGELRLSPSEGVWVLRMNRGQCWAASGTPDTLPVPLRHPPQRLAVFLDVEAGLLGFSDAETAAPLHDYTGAGWATPLRAFFWLWDVGGELKLGP
ncbi:tripartite motif-containing protein 15-like [Tachyglossus aculeatus]|uniref:tripartite motif-containing protein 15-like n=1 Tax=Tachyglossus aculeatus TaxID=9261 RepID=UPI0018F5075B|nr:tripartite motif-containing protein 15-like [Tachyglossus aculeatus]